MHPVVKSAEMGNWSAKVAQDTFNISTAAGLLAAGAGVQALRVISVFVQFVQFVFLCDFRLFSFLCLFIIDSLFVKVF